MYLYPFLYLKWKVDSIMAELGRKEIILLTIHWLLMFNANILVMITAQLVSGFIIAIVLTGNHEREYRFKEKIDRPFIEHQIVATRNYDYHGYFWLMMLGGMQYQTEHHFFPQIPF
jgi:fatty acid desaturase